MRKYVLVIAFIVSVGGVALVCTVLRTSRITCHITNASLGVVTGLTVDVAGNRYVMGELKSGESGRVSLTPRNQAGGVVIAFTLPNGTTTTEVVDGYVESKNFRGEVHVEIRAGGEVRIVSNTVGPG